MTVFASAVPVLPVRSIAASSVFYADRLGFEVLHADDGYAVLRRDGVGLNLWAATDETWRDRPGGPPVVSGAESFLAGTASCRIRVDGIDGLHAACAASGIVHPDGPLADTPWGTREFTVLDPDRNCLAFFQPIG
jgi:catechol 2,3-dioxygenase-like lactoylglutathione lyase family enzyme